MREPQSRCMRCGGSSTHHLDKASQYASVDYYRCDQCGHVWVVEKARGAAHDVTERHPKNIADDSDETL